MEPVKVTKVIRGVKGKDLVIKDFKSRFQKFLLTIWNDGVVLTFWRNVMHNHDANSEARLNRQIFNHHHKHRGLGHLARSVSRVTAALASVSSASQLFHFLVDCSGMILKGFGSVAFFAGVRASSFCIHLSCLVCIKPVIRGVWSRLSYGHLRCGLPKASTISFLAPQFFDSVRLSKYNFLTHTKT
jgi:hypothetical protein